jgi:predicted RNA-binding protein with PIN domain
MCSLSCPPTTSSSWRGRRGAELARPRASTSGRRLIVDGMNVIGSRPDGWWRDRRGAMRSLVAALAAHAARERAEATVVFDGRPFELGDDATGSVEVVFASRAGRDAADDDIVSLVERANRPDELWVVTSDEELARRVRALGARVVGARGFRGVLERGAAGPP